MEWKQSRQRLTSYILSFESGKVRDNFSMNQELTMKPNKVVETRIHNSTLKVELGYLITNLRSQN